MRFNGRVHDCVVVMLVDTRSTHNFLDPMIARKVGLLVGSNDQIEVRVANGERIRSEGKVEEVDFQVQGNKFSTDFYFFRLTLGGCDAVTKNSWVCIVGF